MIRTPPQHNITNPPGQWVNKEIGQKQVVKQEKTLAKEIDSFKEAQDGSTESVRQSKHLESNE